MCVCVSLCVCVCMCVCTYMYVCEGVFASEKGRLYSSRACLSTVSPTPRDTPLLLCPLRYSAHRVKG